MNNAAQDHDEIVNKSPSNFFQLLSSILTVVILSVVFGGLSYAFIEFNQSILQLPIPNSVWCGMAMVLAVLYYLIQRNSKNKQQQNT